VPRHRQTKRAGVETTQAIQSAGMRAQRRWGLVWTLFSKSYKQYVAISRRPSEVGVDGRIARYQACERVAVRQKTTVVERRENADALAS